HTFTRFEDDPEAVTGTIGRAAPHMHLRLIDEHGRDVPPGAEGEIAAKGPSVHLGYYKNPAANAELFTADGWFRTGDLGVVDRAGNVRIVGRLKEMINRGGKKFFPREVEEILYTHPPRIPPCCTPRSSACPIHDWASATACASSRTRARACRCRRWSRICATAWRPTSCPRSSRSSTSSRSRRRGRSNATR